MHCSYLKMELILSIESNARKQFVLDLYDRNYKIYELKSSGSTQILESKKTRKMWNETIPIYEYYYTQNNFFNEYFSILSIKSYERAKIYVDTYNASAERHFKGILKSSSRPMQK